MNLLGGFVWESVMERAISCELWNFSDKVSTQFSKWITVLHLISAAELLHGVFILSSNYSAIDRTRTPVTHCKSDASKILR